MFWVTILGAKMLPQIVKMPKVFLKATFSICVRFLAKYLIYYQAFYELLVDQYTSMSMFVCQSIALHSKSVFDSRLWYSSPNGKPHDRQKLLSAETEKRL